MRLGALLAAVLCLLAAPAVAGPWEDALAAHDAGRYEEALELLKPLAEGGNLDAQNKLSHMYWYGEGTEPDYPTALGWSRRAAAAGSAAAMHDIGSHYAAGLGVEQSDEKAFEWFLKSAEAGDPMSAGGVSLWYLMGRGTEVDLAKYTYWQNIALAQGEKYAQLFVAQSRLQAGNLSGVDDLLQRAAAQRLPVAAFQLGELFPSGEDGWPVDPAQAYMWMTVADAVGCLEAPAILTRIAAGMDAAQLEESARLAALWLELHPVEPGEVHPVKLKACRQPPSVKG
jgi:TPR repeat protein